LVSLGQKRSSRKPLTNILPAMNIMFQFWTDKVPVEAVIVAMILIYALLNTITVRYFGISEFYMSIFKVLLVIGLFFFTFITMVC
jgi:amino acid transporter